MVELSVLMARMELILQEVTVVNLVEMHNLTKMELLKKEK
jgi:hypothetical protein